MRRLPKDRRGSEHVLPEQSGFFDEKRSWSEYKDLILDYYLKPYLAKVARLRKPVAIVDCFAGPGRFAGGEPGSPLIIAKHILQARERGDNVGGLFIEANCERFQELQCNLSESGLQDSARHGDFHSFVGEIVRLASTHTIFVYVDPFKPRDLKFDDLKGVYDKLQKGQSIETLVNFQSTNFVRGALGCVIKNAQNRSLPSNHPTVQTCDEIAGGDYWKPIVLDDRLDHGQKAEKVAHAYTLHLRKSFRFVLGYPIREKYKDKCPKYHLIFGSRHPDAVDLMNDAMVKARREFVGAHFVKGMLFDNQPKEEVVVESEIRNLLLRTLEESGRTTWKLLRVHAIMNEPSKYKESEYNSAIKRLISKKQIGSTSQGHRKENKAKVWLV